MKITKATAKEQAEYAATKPVYQLYGYVTVDGVKVPVEFLGEGKDQPNYEAIAPKGMSFDHQLHTVIGTTQADLLQQMSAYPLVVVCECADCKQERVLEDS